MAFEGLTEKLTNAFMSLMFLLVGQYVQARIKRRMVYILLFRASLRCYFDITLIMLTA